MELVLDVGLAQKADHMTVQSFKGWYNMRKQQKH